MNSSFQAGIKAAKQGININNSHPHNHEDFVAGYKSVNENAKEDLDLKIIAMNMAPDEYPYEEVKGYLTKNDIYLFKQNQTICSANVGDENLKILNTLLDHGHLVKVKLKTITKSN